MTKKRTRTQQKRPRPHVAKSEDGLYYSAKHGAVDQLEYADIAYWVRCPVEAPDADFTWVRLTDGQRLRLVATMLEDVQSLLGCMAVDVRLVNQAALEHLLDSVAGAAKLVS